MNIVKRFFNKVKKGINININFGTNEKIVISGEVFVNGKKIDPNSKQGKEVRNRVNREMERVNKVKK